MTYQYKMLDGYGGYEPGNIWAEAAGGVDQQNAREVEGFLLLLDPLAGKIPVIAANSEFVCTDGTSIVLEFSDRQSYALISRHECDMTQQDDPIRLFVHLLDRISSRRVIAPLTFDDLNFE